MVRTEAILEELSKVEKGSKAKAKTLQNDREWRFPKDERNYSNVMSRSEWFVGASFVNGCSCTSKEQEKGPHAGNMEIHE